MRLGTIVSVIGGLTEPAPTMRSNAKMLAVLAGVGLLLIAVLLTWGGESLGPVDATTSTVGATPSAPAEPVPRRVSGPDSDTGDRVAVRADTGRSAPANSVGPCHVVRGRVLDCQGQPLPNVSVRLCAFDLRASRLGERLPGEVQSDSFGAFELTLAPGEVVAPVVGDGYCTLRTTPVWGQSDAETLVVAARAIALAGRVLDTDGLPLALVRVEVMSLLLAGFPLPLHDAVDVLRASAVTTGENGRFELATIPLAPGIDLLFTRAGYRSKRVPCLEGAGGSLDVTLEKLTAAAGKITGLVLDRAGRAVAGADLRLDRDQRTESGADGAFEFEYPEHPSCLLATRPGFLPVARDGIDKATPMPLLVEFDAEALGITGRVVAHDGTPMSGMLVNVVDPEPSPSRAPIERLSSPGVEKLPDGALGRTDADGRFSIAGLLDRDYTLRAWDQESALSVQSDPVRAGSRDIVLRFPRDPVLDELGGIVVDRTGQPVASAIVSTFLLVSTQDGVVTAHGGVERTGEDGRFTLVNVARRHVELTVSGEGVVYTKLPIERCIAERELRIVVQRLCHVQLEGDVGFVVRFLDADGVALFAQVSTRGSAFSTNAWRMRATTSPVMQVPESAVTITWSRDGAELGRKAIALVPGAGDAESVELFVVGR